MTTGTPARYICKRCEAESPRGIGYVDDVTIGPLPAPASWCFNPHAADFGTLNGERVAPDYRVT